MSDYSVPIPGPLSLGDIIDRAFRLYRAHFGRLTGVLALVLIPWAVLFIAVTYGVATSQSAGLSLLSTLMSFADTFVTGLAGLAVYFTIVAVLGGSRMSAGEAWRRALGRFWSWLGMTLLMGLAIIGVAIPGYLLIFVPITLAGIEPSYSASGAFMIITIVLMLVGVLLAFIPLIYLTARWIVSVPALVVEGLGAKASLGRSWALTKRRVWRCVGFAVLIGLLSILVMFWPSLLTFAQLSGNAGGGASSLLTSVAVALLTKVLTILWTPLQVAAYLFFYYDLRVRAEGYDLAQRVEQLSDAAGLGEAGVVSDEEPVA